MNPTDLPRHLASKIEVDEVSGCWIWTGPRQQDGYGVANRGPSTSTAHRVVYEALVGPIPAGLQLDHLCRVRPCCNPAHVEPVTRTENRRRALAEKTTCLSGAHAWTPENILTRPDGVRTCQPCLRAAKARFDERRRERLAAERRAS